MCVSYNSHPSYTIGQSTSSLPPQPRAKCIRRRERSNGEQAKSLKLNFGSVKCLTRAQCCQSDSESVMRPAGADFRDPLTDNHGAYGRLIIPVAVLQMGGWFGLDQLMVDNL